MQTDNDKTIELLYILNYYPSLNKLISIVQQNSPEITSGDKTVPRETYHYTIN